MNIVHRPYAEGRVYLALSKSGSETLFVRYSMGKFYKFGDERPYLARDFLIVDTTPVDDRLNDLGRELAVLKQGPMKSNFVSLWSQFKKEGLHDVIHKINEKGLKTVQQMKFYELVKAVMDSSYRSILDDYLTHTQIRNIIRYKVRRWVVRDYDCVDALSIALDIHPQRMYPLAWQLPETDDPNAILLQNALFDTGLDPTVAGSLAKWSYTTIRDWCTRPKDPEKAKAVIKQLEALK